MNKLLLTSLLPLATIASLSYGDARNPIGEKATYTIDTNADRTTGLVQDGTFVLTVGSATADGSTYKLNVAYNVDLNILGNKTGNQDMDVSAAFFAPDFLANLRTSKHFESTAFKVDYLGTEDVTTLDGHTYTQTDKVRIYDINTDIKTPVTALAMTMLASPAFTADSPIPKNMQVIVDIAEGVPALGAVRVDLSGSQGVVSIKAGADYQAP